MSEAKIDWEGKCPFCGGYISAENSTMSLFHAEPYCTEFVKMDLFDFLTAIKNGPVKKALAGYMPKKGK